MMSNLMIELRKFSFPSLIIEKSIKIENPNSTRSSGAYLLSMFLLIIHKDKRHYLAGGWSFIPGEASLAIIALNSPLVKAKYFLIPN